MKFLMQKRYGTEHTRNVRVLPCGVPQGVHYQRLRQYNTRV